MPSSRCSPLARRVCRTPASSSMWIPSRPPITWSSACLGAAMPWPSPGAWDSMNRSSSRPRALVSPEDQQADTLLARVKEANEGGRARTDKRPSSASSRSSDSNESCVANRSIWKSLAAKSSISARDQARSDLERVRSEIRRLRLTLLQEGGSSPVVKEVAGRRRSHG